MCSNYIHTGMSSEIKIQNYEATNPQQKITLYPRDSNSKSKNEDRKTDHYAAGCRLLRWLLVAAVKRGSAQLQSTTNNLVV